MAKIKDCDAGKEFVFKLPNGTVIGKAKNRLELIEIIKGAPVASLVFHTRGSHFSPWLEMLGEKKAADVLRTVKVDEGTIRMDLLRQLR